VKIQASAGDPKIIYQLKKLICLFSRIRSRSLSELIRQTTPRTKNGHAMPAPAPMPTPNTHNYYGPVHIGDNTYNGKAINVKDKASELKLCQGI
jgi:hypothetical protein